MLSLVDGEAKLWGAMILRAARDVRMVSLKIPENPRSGERQVPFEIRRRKAKNDQHDGREAVLFFNSMYFRNICELCGADPDNVLDLLRRERLKV